VLVSAADHGVAVEMPHTGSVYGAGWSSSDRAFASQTAAALVASVPFAALLRSLAKEPEE
jgi:hypothetical protein